MSPGDAIGQSVQREKPCLGDFERGLEYLLAKVAEHEAGNVVAGELPVIEEDAVQLWRFLRHNAGFLAQFAQGRHLQRLATLHPTAGKHPARRIVMPHQQYPSAVVKHGGARAQRQPAQLPVHRLQHHPRHGLEQQTPEHCFLLEPCAPCAKLVKSAPMSSTVSFRPVAGKAGTRAFLDVPFAVYRNDPHWVAPLYLERFEHLDPKKNPYFEHAEAQLFLAERDGRPVGRISAQVDRLRIERYKDATGQFGFLEALDDPAIFAALFEAAGSWLKQRGMARAQGPFSFSINDETGLLVDGFDTPPNMMMGHGAPYYGARVEEQGFAKVKDVIAFSYDGLTELPRAMQATYRKALASSEIDIRCFDKKHLARDLDIIIAIFNDAWSENWGFVPFTRAEITTLGNNLKMLVANEYISIASYRGEPAAMAVTLPNINDWITGLNGRLLPFGWAKLAWHLLAKPPASVRMPLMGVRKQYHGTMIGSALALGVIDTLRRYHMGRGTKSGELSWILEDNLPMRRLIEALGGKPYKTYRVYEKALA